MILPLGTAIVIGEYEVISAFLWPMGITILIAIVFFILTRRNKFSLSTRSAFATVASCWFFASVLGAIPFLISGSISNFTDALFESVSGFTTTGSTILTNIEVLPRSIALWRAQLHWLGGMGIVALTVALLPLLGVGGFQLIKAETTGPEKGKITPKITVTAKILWFIYLGLTVIQIVLLMLFGKMDFIDAAAHTFATLGTGGFSTKNASIGGFNSVAVDVICTVFMILAGVNFSLYYQIILGRGKEIFSNSEFKAYLGIIIISILIVTIAITPEYKNFFTALRFGAFQVVSIITTTGFATTDFTKWAPLAQIVLLLLMFVGGCSGSTGGSIKVVRWVILWKQMKNEIRKMLHPHGVFSVRLNDRVGRKDVVFSVAAFIFLYLCLVAITAIVAAVDGADVLTSLTAGITLVGNVGPGFGKIGPVDNFSFFSPLVKWWFSFAMLAGRLELYTMIMFFVPSFWKK